MTQHILTYLGAVKPWPCEVCGKCIVRKNQLMLHTRKHAGKNLGLLGMWESLVRKGHITHDKSSRN